MNTYFIPRNTKGEGKILYIFSTKALIYTAVGATIGAIIYYICTLFNIGLIGLIAIGIFALIGFCIGTIKIPESGSLAISKKAGGLYIDEVILTYFKFKSKKNKLYVNCEEVTEDE